MGFFFSVRGLIDFLLSEIYYLHTFATDVFTFAIGEIAESSKL